MSGYPTWNQWKNQWSHKTATKIEALVEVGALENYEPDKALRQSGTEARLTLAWSDLLDKIVEASRAEFEAGLIPDQILPQRKYTQVDRNGKEKTCDDYDGFRRSLKGLLNKEGYIFIQKSSPFRFEYRDGKSTYRRKKELAAHTQGGTFNREPTVGGYEGIPPEELAGATSKPTVGWDAHSSSVDHIGFQTAMICSQFHPFAVIPTTVKEEANNNHCTPNIAPCIGGIQYCPEGAEQVNEHFTEYTRNIHNNHNNDHWGSSVSKPQTVVSGDMYMKTEPHTNEYQFTPPSLTPPELEIADYSQSGVYKEEDWLGDQTNANYGNMAEPTNSELLERLEREHSPGVWSYASYGPRSREASPAVGGFNGIRSPMHPSCLRSRESTPFSPTTPPHPSTTTTTSTPNSNLREPQLLSSIPTAIPPHGNQSHSFGHLPNDVEEEDEEEEEEEEQQQQQRCTHYTQEEEQGNESSWPHPGYIQSSPFTSPNWPSVGENSAFPQLPTPPLLPPPLNSDGSDLTHSMSVDGEGFNGLM